MACLVQKLFKCKGGFGNLVDLANYLYNFSNFTYPRVDPDECYLEEEGVQVGEDVPLQGEDGGEVGEEEVGGQASQGHGQEGQQAGDHCTQLHQQVILGGEDLVGRRKQNQG